MAPRHPNTSGNDYGHGDPSKLKSFTIKSYDFKSTSDMKVRYTGGYGDNAMADPSQVNEGEGDESEVDLLHTKLNEAGITDEEIATPGFDIKEASKQKVAGMLGIDVESIPALIGSLVKKVKGEGPAENYIAERKPSIIDEINQDVGTFDFPWKLDSRKGTATAVYKSEDRKFWIKVPHVFDEHGRPAELSDDDRKALRKQAINYIGKE